MAEVRLHAIAAEGPGESAPVDPARAVEGAPSTTTWNTYARGERVFAGVWSGQPGAWRVSYAEWEFCEVLSGACELTPDGGEVRRFGAGEAFVVEPGFEGVWRVLEPMTKRYVVMTEPPA